MTRSDFIEIEISISISVNMTRMSGLETQQKRTTTITILPILGCRKKLNVGQRDCTELLPQRMCFDCRIFGERYFVSRTRKIISQVTHKANLASPEFSPAFRGGYGQDVPRSDGTESSRRWLFVIIQDAHYVILIYKWLKPMLTRWRRKIA